MRRHILPILFAMLLLCGCTDADAARLRARRGDFAGAEQLRFTADIRANLDSEVFACTLECTATAEETLVEVTAPASVAGIRARVKQGQTTLEYDGISLGVGSAGASDLSPLSAGPLLMAALRTGNILRTWTERDGDVPLLTAEIYVSDTVEATLWFAADSLTPCHAELRRDGAVVLSCEISNFEYT